LALADLKKDAGGFDLPIALGLLLAAARSPAIGPARSPSSASWR
jgi:predicted ATPase with chaperone activity